MVQPKVRNGRILPNEEQPTDYLLSYVDSLLDAASVHINDRKMFSPQGGNVGIGMDELIKQTNVHLNTARDVIHVLQSREGWRQSGDGGYK